jgi:hypothetical protein
VFTMSYELNLLCNLDERRAPKAEHSSLLF